MSGYEKSPDYGSGNDPELDRKVRRWTIITAVAFVAVFMLLAIAL